MRDCPLCGRWDCDCEDILTPGEYEKLVAEEMENISSTEWEE